MYWTHHMMGRGGGLGMVLFWVIVIVLVALVIKWIVPKANKREKSQDDSSAPMDILRQRYARGEIDKAEFKEKKKVLKE